MIGSIRLRCSEPDSISCWSRRPFAMSAAGPPRHARIASASVVLQRFDLGFMLFLGGANGCGVLSHERHDPVARRLLITFADPFHDPANVLGGPLLGFIKPAIGDVVSVRDR